MRSILATTAAMIAVGCGPNAVVPTGDAAGPAGDAAGSCRNLECYQQACPGGGTTTLSGIVTAPNGTLPLPNVTVYVPNGQVQPLLDGLTCDRCGAELSGEPLVQAKTDAVGRFELHDVPATNGVPLVIQLGKWRREILIPAVPACVDTPLEAEQTRLPRSRTEGDLPRIALATGGADALECLLRKVGIDDAEIGTKGGVQRIHLYAGYSGAAALEWGGGLAAATQLWGSLDSLRSYDIVILSCEGTTDAQSKPAAALQAMSDYVGLGGRTFASHWHNYWLTHGPEPFPQTVTMQELADLDEIEADIDTSFEKGSLLAEWLVNVGASTVPGKIAITAAQHTITAVNPALAQRWIYEDVTANGAPSVQYLSFTTPLTAPPAERCGRFVFSDLHVSAEDFSSEEDPFPTGCVSTVLTPQEKVLAFMLFDIGSCVGPVIE